MPDWHPIIPAFPELPREVLRSNRAELDGWVSLRLTMAE